MAVEEKTPLSRDAALTQAEYYSHRVKEIVAEDHYLYGATIYGTMMEIIEELGIGS